MALRVFVIAADTSEQTRAAAESPESSRMEKPSSVGVTRIYQSIGFKVIGGSFGLRAG